MGQGSWVGHGELDSLVGPVELVSWVEYDPGVGHGEHDSWVGAWLLVGIGFWGWTWG